MQKGNRTTIDKNGKSIGFELYRVENKEYVKCILNNSPLGKKFFKRRRPESCYSNTINFRKVQEVVGRFMVSPGRFCVVPSTFYPKQDGDFLLRIFSENDFVVEAS